MLNRNFAAASIAMLLTAGTALADRTGTAGVPGSSDSPAGTARPQNDGSLAGVITGGPALPSPGDRPDLSGVPDNDLNPASCPSDINGSGTVDWVDVVDFLAMYFAGSPAADLSRQNGCDPVDLYKFIDAWVGGC